MPDCGFLLGLHLFLQAFDDDAHLVDGVGALLDEILHDAHALVVGLLQARDGVLELLNLGLQLHHVLADGEGGEALKTMAASRSCGGRRSLLGWWLDCWMVFMEAARSAFCLPAQPSRCELLEGRAGVRR